MYPNGAPVGEVVDMHRSYSAYLTDSTISNLHSTIPNVYSTTPNRCPIDLSTRSANRCPIDSSIRSANRDFRLHESLDSGPLRDNAGPQWPGYFGFANHTNDSDLVTSRRQGDDSVTGISPNRIKDVSCDLQEASFGRERRALSPEKRKLQAKLCFRTETKKTYVCTYHHCNERFTRIYDLHRHHRGVHEGEANFRCRYTGCLRAVKAFPRKDKRNEHERKIHGCGVASLGCAQ